MAPLQDPEVFAVIQHALQEGVRFSGYVTWKPRAAEWVRQNVPNLTLQGMAERLLEYVESGGEIDQVRETRDEWSEFKFHYDLRVPFGDRRLYVETVLLSEDPDDPEIQVVNVHDV